MPRLLGRRVSALNLTLAAVLVLLIGTGAYVFLHGSSSGAATQVTTATAAVTDVSSTVTASGTAEPESSASLSFGTNGTVSSIDVKVGDKVNKGDCLAVASSDTAALQLEAAQASYSDTLSKYIADKNNAKAQNPTSYASVLQARISMQQAQATVNGLYITSPISGTVTAINGNVGESTSGSSSSSGSSGSSGAGSGSSGGSGSGGAASSSSSSSSSSSTAFITVAKLTKYLVTGSFSETDVAKIRTGEAASITFNAIEGKTFTGSVDSIDLTSSTSNGVVSYGVKITVSSPPANLREGATATITITITTASASGVLAVPTSAVTTANGISTVTLVKNGTSTSRTVTIGVKGDTYTQVMSGLSAGDKISLGAVSTSSNTGRFPGGGFPGGGVGGGGGGQFRNGGGSTLGGGRG